METKLPIMNIRGLINKGSLKKQPLNKEPNPSYRVRYDLNQLQKYESVLNHHKNSLTDFEKVLEFGCGHGRLIQYLFGINTKASVFGTDILQEQVNKCKEKFPQGVFIRNGSEPPIELEDNQFDLIYSYSVFTHLSEINHLAWLKELCRILKPGGKMLHSVKSYEFVRRAKIFSPQNLVKYELIEPYEQFEIDYPYHYIVDNPNTPEYGLTIISKNYIMENWHKETGLEILDYAEGCIEAYPEGCHDLVLLHKS